MTQDEMLKVAKAEMLMQILYDNGFDELDDLYVISQACWDALRNDEFPEFNFEPVLSFR